LEADLASVLAREKALFGAVLTLFHGVMSTHCAQVVANFHFLPGKMFSPYVPAT
jgi:hypothetical protein